MKKGFHHSEKTKQKISLSKMGHSVSQETRKKIGKAHKKLYASGHINHFKGKHHSEETKRKISQNKKRGQKISKALKGRVFTKEWKKKISIANSISKVDWDFYFKHGCLKSNYPYPDEFNKKLKTKIAKRDNYICQICNEVLPDKFHIHHIDYNKDNYKENNLVFLCNYCHMKTNHHRDFWIEFFKENMGGE